MSTAASAAAGQTLDAAAQLTDLSIPALGTHFAVDFLALLGLIGLAYRHRRSDNEMVLALIVLNLGLFATVIAISAQTFSAGVGFGLFGMLSLIRLRSASFTSADMAYAFVVLVIGLICGLLTFRIGPTVLIVGVLVVAVLIVDRPGSKNVATREITLVMDRIYRSPGLAALDAESRLGLPVLSSAIAEVDYVREVTKVIVTVADPAVAVGSVRRLPSQ